jgi:uncharacterized protein (TIGR01777 family)
MAAQKILVTGVSGPIGQALLPSLQERGYQVTRMVRGPARGADQISWDPARPVAPQSVSGFDAVIHLAGESIVGRWNAAKKARIRDSRVQGTRHLSAALASAEARPRIFISGSAIGFYGDRGQQVLREDSPPGHGFLPEVCMEWEAATEVAQAAGIRTVHLRTGVVLSRKGGALEKMLPPFKMGLGGKLGSGSQWFSWIAVGDMVGGIHHILGNNAMTGPVNMVAPNAATNLEFTKTLASVLSRPAIFPVPAFAARLAFGEMADALLLASQRVEPAQLKSTGYAFLYPDLRGALEALLRG